MLHRTALVVQVLVMTALAAFSVVGHGPWAGPLVFALSPRHGINQGDLVVAALWVVGIVVSAVMWRRPRGPARH